MSKKKIIAILLFIFISLFMFAFADTGKDQKDNNKSNIDTDEKVEEVSKEEINTDTDENSNVISDKVNKPTLVLDPNGDEDKDGYTNGEEKENGSDPLDPNSKPFDNIAPIITINGQPSLVIFVGDSYEDEGARALDNLDGDITDKIVISNSVNPMMAGNYEVMYTVKDRAGNVAVAKREVKVASLADDEDKDGYTNGEEKDNGSNPLDPNSKPEDKEAPTITLKGENPVVLLKGEEYKEAGAEATDNLDGDITAKIVIDNQVNTQRAGEYEVTYTVEDRAGNKTTEERVVKVLSRDGDEDKDGYTNEEEKENGTDPLDPNSKPVDKAPIITVNPTEVKIVEGVSYDVMTGVSVEDDFDTLTATANIIETNTLSVGEHTITYTVEDRAGNKTTEERVVKVLSKDGDEDKDGYTNGEEKENGTDPLDPNSKPEDKAPIITVNPTEVKIVEGVSYDVMTGVSVEDDFDTLTATASITETNTLEVGDHTITYTAKDRAGNKTTEERVVKVLSRDGDEDKDGYTNGEEKDNGSNPLDPNSKPEDKEAPTITLKGENPVVLLEGEEYKEAGAKATDNLDGDITDKVVIDNQVNTQKAGDYEVTYTVEDRAGNKTTEEREVKVLSKDGDEDNDGYTNEEEKENGTNPLDPNSRPVDNAPTITVNPNFVEINEDEGYDVMTGVSVTDDFDTVIVSADITETSTLIPGTYTITYTTTSDRIGQIGTATRTLVIKAVDKEPPVITANDVNANGQPEAVINVNVVDTGSGVKEVHYLPKAYNSVQEYMADVNSSTQPVDPINLTLDENGNATITSYFDTTYTIYAVDNKGNASVKKVSTTGIEQSKEDIVDDDNATIESIKGATISVGKNTTKGYFLNFLKLNPRRDIKVTANEGYEIQSVKWSTGRQNLQYFQDGNGNVEDLEFTLGDSRYTNVYTLYVKTKNTTTNEIYEGVAYIYNNAYWFWIARI